jgi:hypothetical protein
VELFPVAGAEDSLLVLRRLAMLVPTMEWPSMINTPIGDFLLISAFSFWDHRLLT